LEIAVGMSYPRLLGRTREVRTAFRAPWKGTQAVKELDERMFSALL